jgi:hypothetical protein
MEKKVKRPRKAETAKRVPFKWEKLKAMWDAGKSYAEMAKALDPHYAPEGDDPTKSIRAKVSVATNKGVSINGTLVHFQRRKKLIPMKNPKSKTKTTKSVKKAAKKKTASPITPDTAITTLSEA